MVKKKGISAALAICLAGLLWEPARIFAREGTVSELVREYETYQADFAGIETKKDIEDAGYEIIEPQSFSVLLETFGETEVQFLPAMHRKYHRLVLFIADDRGRVLFRTEQLETNYKNRESLEQPIKNLAAVSFQDLNQDGLTDIVLITNCENASGEYAGKDYKVGDVLFQKDGEFYRDWRISDKINRFSMNKSADFIASYVRDGNSTEVLYTAVTLEELLESGFRITEEQCYSRFFEKLGRLTVVPGILRIAEYDIFMIYLVNEQGYIVWSFQPMGDYDNLYALKGMTCRDVDGDEMKDIIVLARYSYSGEDGELLIDTKCHIYYQRTDGFAEDRDFDEIYQCTEEDTLGGLVDIIREYWGWTKEK